MLRGITTFGDVEIKLSNTIAGIRKRFPDRLNYLYSKTNPIAESLKLTISEQTGMKEDAYLLDRQIVINQDITFGERRNFSFFHEISHHLISTDDEILSFLMEFHAGKEKDFAQYIETLCNFGAGEFLAPIAEIRQQISQEKFSIALIQKLDSVFPASKPAILFQLARAATHKCTLVIIDRGVVPQPTRHKIFHNTPITQEQYYILYSATSKRNKYRPGRYTIIPKYHILRNAFEEQSFVSGKDFIPYKSGNRNHKCDCEAMYLQGKVYGLFNLAQPQNTHLQPRLF